MTEPSRRAWLATALGSVTGRPGVQAVLGALGTLATFGALGGCGARGQPLPPATWIGTGAARGHRLRQARPAGPPRADVQRRTGVLIVGGGIAGLAAARALMRAGVDDFALLELEDQTGGNSRGHQLGGMPCPLGAHYLPLPGPAAEGVNEWLHELGLLRVENGRSAVDERHLCHSPQERLYFEGSWHDGLLPPAAAGSTTLAQYRRYAARVDELTPLGFAIPTHRAPWSEAHAALDAQTFAAWLDAEGLDDARLRWYLDYCCRDDYGAGAGEVSAWAGLHYFASRHGFHPPGDESAARDAVLTWPEGNSWLARRLAEPLGGRVLPARLALAVAPQREGAQAWAWDAAHDRIEHWQARRVVMAVPLFVAARLLQPAPPELVQAASGARYAPWLVTNLGLREPLLDRGLGAPASWDNVRYGAPSLGYVDAGHQRLSPLPGPTVLTAYWALPEAQRGALLAASADDWARRVVDDLMPMHPDLPQLLTGIELARHGHAMSIPAPGRRGSPALAALRKARGPVHYAHADLSAYSVFEEAFEHGLRAGAAAAR